MTQSLRRRVALFFVTIIALVPPMGYAQSLPFGSVDGRVRIINGDSAMVLVQLQRFGTTVQEQVSADGHFAFRNVSSGRYTLSIRVPGHGPVTQEISVPG